MCIHHAILILLSMVELASTNSPPSSTIRYYNIISVTSSQRSKLSSQIKSSILSFLVHIYEYDYISICCWFLLRYCFIYNYSNSMSCLFLCCRQYSSYSFLYWTYICKWRWWWKRWFWLKWWQWGHWWGRRRRWRWLRRRWWWRIKHPAS
jgi:hypothetical protein